MKTIGYSLIVLTIIIISVNASWFGEILLFSLMIFAAFGTITMLSSHYFMNNFPVPGLSAQYSTAMTDLLTEIWNAYSRWSFLAIDITIDLIQVGILLACGFYFTAGILFLAHVLGYSVYYRVPTFFRSINNGREAHTDANQSNPGV